MIIAFIYLGVIVIASLYLITSERSDSHKNFNQSEIISKIDQLLPQTQCGDCGYEGCKPYAIAIVRNLTDINRCPPGGLQTMKELSGLTGKPATTLINKIDNRLVAVIEEEHCIGCVKCIKACPVDAIVGADKQMHSIIPQYCTGCELCVAPCPVDCIIMKPV